MNHDTWSAPISQKQDEHNRYVIIKIMCSFGYHQQQELCGNSCTWQRYIGKINYPKFTTLLCKVLCHSFHDFSLYNTDISELQVLLGTAKAFIEYFFSLY